MKLKLIISVIIWGLIITSCAKPSTEYSGYIKNSTDNTITFEIIGDTLLFDSLSIAPGLTRKIYHDKEDGDFEIYDCRSFFDTIYYKNEGNEFSLTSDKAIITATFNLESNEIRVHACTIDIK